MLAGAPPLSSRDLNLGFRSQDLLVYSISSPHTFFLFHKDLPVEVGRGVFLDGAWRSIIHHATAAAFQLNPSTASRDLLISSSLALELVKTAFARDVLDRAKVGSTPKSICFPMELLPLMHSLFKVLHEKNRFVLQAVLDRDFSALSKVLLDFKPLLGVMFADGWDVCPAFEAFSKPDIINLLEAAIDFVGPVSPYVPPRFLRLEADRRGVVVDFFILACYTFS